LIESPEIPAISGYPRQISSSRRDGTTVKSQANLTESNFLGLVVIKETTASAIDTSISVREI
jgi:hypothetical protein